MAETAPPQADLVAAFEAGGVDGVVLDAPRIDTHISHVFLTGTRALKLKRAVELPFVDFSTLDRRQRACEAELEVNQRFASQMYLGVRAVRRVGEGHYRLGGREGEIVDWVVEMRRFDQADQFDRMARSGRLDHDILAQTGDAIAVAHADCPRVTTAGHAADYRGILRELRRTETHGARQIGLEPGEPDLYGLLDHALGPIDPLIEARRRAGRVRHTHGDLHLRNICLFDGKPTPFDALEFNPRLGTTDVLYDLAFLLMDLVHAGLRPGANRLMNQYLDRSGEDESGLALLPFFMALRAGVRMAVELEAGNVETADTYRILAQELISRKDPMTLAIGGLSGSGKSTIARHLAPALPGPAGARILRSDVVRKVSAGRDLSETMSDAAYSGAARIAVYRQLLGRAQEGFDAGASIIIDATFQDQEMRDMLTASGGLPVIGVWLDVPLDERLRRIAGRSDDASDADGEVASRQIAPDDPGPGWQKFDASDTPSTVKQRIIDSLKPNSPRRA